MTEPYNPRFNKCPVCGWTGAHAPSCPNGTPPPAQYRALLVDYVDLRRSCMSVEELIEQADFTEEERKTLDKSVTVIKVGFKMIKQVLKQNGAITSTWRETTAQKTKP